MRTLELCEVNTISGGEVSEDTMYETLWVQDWFQSEARKAGIGLGICLGVIGTAVATAIEGQFNVASAAFGLASAACGYNIGYANSYIWIN